VWTREEGDEDTKETMGQRGAAKRADSNDTRGQRRRRRRRAQRQKSMEDPRNRLAPSNQQAQIAIGLDSNRDEGKLRKKTDLGGGGKTANLNPAGRVGIYRYHRYICIYVYMANTYIRRIQEVALCLQFHLSGIYGGS
jgi:hypothetical protein